MSLLCQIGFHKPGAAVVANGGCSFAACRRCGRDLVRTASGRWHVPRGYRVVWKTRAEAAVDVLLTQPSSGQARRPRAGELPIQEVLRQLYANDFMKEEGDGAWDADIRVGVENARGRVQIDDFMKGNTSDLHLGSGRQELPDLDDYQAHARRRGAS